MRKMISFVVIAFIFALLVSCQTYSITFISSFSGIQQEAVDAYSSYIKGLATGNIQDTYSYESVFLWPSLEKDLYKSLRESHKEFQSLIARSTFTFTQSTHQAQWGVYGQKYKDAYILSFDIKYPDELSIEEKSASQLIGTGPFITVGVKMDNQWKFLPSFGPELIDIKNAESAYNDYLKTIIENRFEDTWHFMPLKMLDGAGKEAVKNDWVGNGGKEISEFLNALDLKAVSGRVEFGPNLMGTNYVFGIVFNVFLDTAKLEYNGKNDQIKLIIDDWASSRNMTVKLVFEDSWKIIAENPLF
jgi:hypothetical protein